MKYFLCVCLSVFLASACQKQVVRFETPNIVIIYTDDQGYGDLSCYGSPDIRTPHIDQLAEEGLKLTSFYVAQPVCTASRVSLLTGCYPNRLGMHGALMPAAGRGINPDESTLAELLRSAGYKTGIFGKWHLGSEPEFNPLNHGFDEFYGIPYSNDMWPGHPWQGSVFDFPSLPLIDGMTAIDTLLDQSNLTRDITRRAIKFIEDNQDSPFFLYVPHPQPHVPLYAHTDFLGHSESGLYGDVIEEIDWSTGQIMQRLEDLDLDEKTWIIYASDNGPWLSYGQHAGKADPLREGKGTVWEGGIRVPCVMRFPGDFPAGKTIHTPVMSIDLLPTICQRVGAKLPALKIDGRNVWDVLTSSTTKSPHAAYFFYYHENELQAMRSGAYKLILPHRYRTVENGSNPDSGIPDPYTYKNIVSPELYNVKEDPGETLNVASDHPTLIDSLMILVDEMRDQLGDRLSDRVGRENRSPGMTNSSR